MSRFDPTPTFSLGAAFLTCDGSLFGCKIYAYPLAKKRIWLDSVS